MDTRQKSENAFKEFLELVHKLTNDDKEIHRMLQKSYDRTNPHFRWSRGFINLVTLCGDKIREVPEKRLLHIREFVVELSNYKAKPLKHLLAGASRVSDSDDSSLEDAPPAKKPNLEAVKASSVGEVGSLTDHQHAPVSNGRKGDEVQTAVSNGAVSNQGEKRKASSLSDKTVKVSEGTNDSDNSECPSKKRWFYNSATVKKSPDDSLPLLGYVRNIHKVSRSVKEKINSSDVICLDDDDDDDDGGETRVTDRRNDHDGVESDVEGETKTTSSDLNFSSTKSDSKLTCLNNIKTSKSGTSSIPKKSNVINNKVPQNEIEVICLDDDDDDDDDEAKEPVTPLLKYRYPVRKLIENSSLLPVKTIADLGVIEIIDIDEKQCEDKTTEIQSISSIRSKPEVWDRSDNVKTSQQADTASDMSAKDKYSKAALDANDEIDGSKCENEYGNADGENGDEALSGGDDEDDKEVEDEEVLKQVKHLICVLRRLGREIQKLALSEMTLDDMNSEESAFIKESELRSKFVESWTLLCDLTGTKFTGRACNKRFAMKIPDYPEIGRQISEFINEGKVFPDFQDIYDIVVSHNSNCSLFLTENAIQDISNRIFTSVGNRIQQHRKLELFKRMKSYLVDDNQPSEDPAMFDTDLCQKLEGNQAIAYEKLQSVFTEFSEKQDAGFDEAAVIEEDDDDDDDDDEDDSCDNDSNDGDENNEDKKESVKEAETHGSSPCVEQSAEAIEQSSITELPSLCVETMSKDTNSPKQEAETIDVGYSEDGDEDDDDENAKMSISDEEEDDILIITFDGIPISHESSVGEAVVISDDQTANESSFTNRLQNSENPTGRIELSDKSQFKIQSDLLNNFRRLTSNITFLSNNSVLGAADNKDSRSDRDGGLECISTTASPPKILEVELGESGEPTKSDLTSAETSLKQPIFDGNINTGQMDSADNVDNTPSEKWTTLLTSAKEIEPENHELLYSRESDTSCDNLPDRCSDTVTATKVTAKDVSPVLEATIDYKALPVIDDDEMELTTAPCGKMQIVPDDLPELSTAGALSPSAPALVISPDFLLVRDGSSVLPASLPCFDVRNSVSEELPVQLADDKVKPVEDLTCATGSLDCEASPLDVDTSGVINSVPFDNCSSSDLDLRLESSYENPEALAVSSDHCISNVAGEVPSCLSSDLELHLESSSPESAETFQQQLLDINPDKSEHLDAANDEATDILLEKP